MSVESVCQYITAHDDRRMREYIVEHNIDVNQKCAEHTITTWAYYVACYRASTNSRDTLQFFVDRGADMNFNGDVMDVLSVLCPSDTEAEILECVEFLIDHGISIDWSSTGGIDGEPFLFFLCERGPKNLELFKLFRKAGADFNVTNSNGWCLLHKICCLIEHTPNTRISFIRMLLENGSNVNSRNNVGQTPLMYAVMCDITGDIVSALIEAGADVNARDVNGETVLMYAATNFGGNKIPLKLLVKRGADIYATRTSDGFNVLEIATEKNAHLDMCRFLTKTYGLFWTMAPEQTRRHNTSNQRQEMEQQYPMYYLTALLRCLRTECVQLGAAAASPLTFPAPQRILAKFNLDDTTNDFRRLLELPYHNLFQAIKDFLAWCAEIPAFSRDVDDIVCEIQMAIAALNFVYTVSAMGQSAILEMATENCKRRRI